MQLRTVKSAILISFLFALTLLTGGGIGVNGVSASEIVVEDSPNVFRAANITQGDTTYSDEVEASPGEAIQLLVMVHLGAEGTSADDVSVRINLNESKTLRSDGQYELVTKAFINSSENNVEDETKIIVPSDQELVFIPEHGVVLTTHGNLPSNVPATPYTWPNPEELFGDGITLGNIESISTVYISFKAYVSNKTANMSITKEVASVTNPDGAWHEAVDAERGDRVRFQIVVKNTGGSELNDVFITDQLPDGLEYVSGSSEYSTPYSDGFKPLADGWITVHANLGNLPVGEGYNAIIIFDALVKSDATEGEHKNTAQAKANEYPDWIYDRATVNVEVPPPTGGVANISIEKKVVWQGNEYDSVSRETHLYDPNEEVEYKLYVTNSGNAAAEDVVVVDHLPPYIRTLDGLDKKEFNIGQVAPGSSWSATYKAKVVGNLPQNDRTQENRATVTSSNAGADEDTAFIWINGPEILAAEVQAAAAPAELPVTGPAVPVAAGLASLLPVGVLLRRRLV